MWTIDLHSYHPRDLEEQGIVGQIVQQAWEMGVLELTLVHGHGKSRGFGRPFANTNTGYLGLTVRGILRNDETLRQWMYAKIDVSHNGSTRIRVRPNSQPSRSDFDPLPDPV